MSHDVTENNDPHRETGDVAPGNSTSFPNVEARGKQNAGSDAAESLPLPETMAPTDEEEAEEEEELEGVSHCGSYTLFTPEAEAFARLKRRKWKWEFLAFGECGDPYRGSAYFRLMIGHTENEQMWAVKQRAVPSTITRVLKVNRPMERHEIAEILLDSATEDFYDGLQIIHDRGEILDPPTRKPRKGS